MSFTLHGSIGDSSSFASSARKRGGRGRSSSSASSSSFFPSSSASSVPRVQQFVKRRGRLSAREIKFLVKFAFDILDPGCTGVVDPIKLDDIRKELYYLITTKNTREKREEQIFISEFGKKTLKKIEEEEENALNTSVDLTLEENEDEEDNSNDSDEAFRKDPQLKDFIVPDDEFEEQERRRNIKKLEHKPHKKYRMDTPDPVFDDELVDDDNQSQDALYDEGDEDEEEEEIMSDEDEEEENEGDEKTELTSSQEKQEGEEEEDAIPVPRRRISKNTKPKKKVIKPKKTLQKTFQIEVISSGEEDEGHASEQSPFAPKSLKTQRANNKTDHSSSKGKKRRVVVTQPSEEQEEDDDAGVGVHEEQQPQHHNENRAIEQDQTEISPDSFNDAQTEVNEND